MYLPIMTGYCTIGKCFRRQSNYLYFFLKGNVLDNLWVYALNDKAITYSFTFIYQVWINFFNHPSIAQLVKHASLIQGTEIQFPLRELFLFQFLMHRCFNI